ncbi:unnamed protein product, partial [Mesorhabditis belari]|uniref:Uncharacterized protein n=1 Tax=Mesorhabditis belari TaxID=2138241 RepID=A0AAF3ENR1_9BILA
MEIPDHFLNKSFVEVRQENVDEFFALRGVPWLIRKLIVGKMKNGRFHLTKNDGGKYHVKIGDPSKNLEYDFELDKTFKATGYDGKQHEITFSMEDGKLREKHLNLERKDSGEDVFFYDLRNNGVLYSECTTKKDNKTITWKREFEQR